MRITVGPSPSSLRTSLSPPNPPMSSHSSSATTLVSCWDAFTPFVTLTPIAFASTFLMNRRTTGRETSASSSARRMSLSGAFVFSALRSSSSFRAFHASSRRWLSVPNASARTTSEPPRSRPRRRCPATERDPAPSRRAGADRADPRTTAPLSPRTRRDPEREGRAAVARAFVIAAAIP